MAKSLFSPSWHIVANLQPQLLVSVRIHRHVYRGNVWYVLQDQTGGRFSRLTPAAYALVSRMDGQRSVQQLWDEACETAEGDIPTQDEILDLLIQLHAADLMQADVTPDSAVLFARYRKRRQQTWKQWLLNPMSLKIPLVDPDRLLGWMATRMGWLFGLPGALLWLTVVLPAAVAAAQHWHELTANLGDRVLATGNLWVMAAVYPVVKAAHELGHGLATRRWGGRVHEMGLMFLIFAPVPYVEASSASAFGSKYQRALVGAAGMLVEVFLAAIALFVWLSAESGVVHAVAFNVMTIAGISTVIVNGNPLLRYDGYYILCDLIEMPNLAQRGQRYLGYLWDRYVFGAQEAEAPLETPSERGWLAVYTVVSWCYRTWLTLSISLFIAGKFFVFGMVLAGWSLFSLLVVPAWKAFQHVRKSPQLHRRRGQAVRLSLVVTALAVVLFTALPLPLRTQADGVIWLPDQALLRAGENGRFERWLVAPGSAVTAGTPVLEMSEPLLVEERDVARGKLEEAAAHYRSEQYEHPERAGIAGQQLEQERRVLARAEERVDRLTIRAETSGVLVVANPQDMPAQFYKKGTLLGYVLTKQEFIARVVVQQDDIDLVRTHLRSVQLRLADNLPQVWNAQVIRETPGGIDELPSPALGPNGGGTIPVDPKDSTGQKALGRVFIFDLKLPADAAPGAFGERVHVRFDHGSEPALVQVYRRLRQLFLSQLNV